MQEDELRLINKRREWMNLPPARIEDFDRYCPYCAQHISRCDCE